MPKKESCLINPPDLKNGVAVLGGGLAGLAAGHTLSAAGRKTAVFEAGPKVGGLSVTLKEGDYLFDIGGHRFHTRNRDVDKYVRTLMGDELIEVSRSSKIFLKDRFFNYPLKPLNAIDGLGVLTTARIVGDYLIETVKGAFGNGRCVSLEDWVVGKFGRTMFNIYFKQYSEKVWGLPCDRISEKWVSQRIRGLSLGKAVKSAFFKFSGRDIPTLTDTFLYPKLGIGRIADRMREEIEKTETVYTSSEAVRLDREGRRVTGLVVQNGGADCAVEAGQYISTVPLTSLVSMMQPAPPQEIIDSARWLRFRDLLLVAVMVDRERVTDQTWIYIPEEKIPFGRIHEPKNWSEQMAPDGKTLLVVEYFCFKGDETWNSGDESLANTTIKGLEKLGFVERQEVIDTKVIRVPNAYPLFEVGFEEHCEKIIQWLDGFENLRTAGRSGSFQYHNMDIAIAVGIEAARQLLDTEKKQ